MSNYEAGEPYIVNIVALLERLEPGTIKVLEVFSEERERGRRWLPEAEVKRLLPQPEERRGLALLEADNAISWLDFGGGEQGYALASPDSIKAALIQHGRLLPKTVLDRSPRPRPSGLSERAVAEQRT